MLAPHRALEAVYIWLAEMVDLRPAAFVRSLETRPLLGLYPA
jgi:hypothetical protein